MSTPVTRFCTFVLCTLLIAVPITAQTVTGTMQGQVTDASGGPLPGVVVTVKNMDTGLERVVVTNEAGLWTAPFLPIGRYQITANMEGLGAQTRRGIELTLNQTAVQNFVLGAQMAQEITVVADQPRINTVNAEIKQSLTAQEIIDKPTPPMTGHTAMLSLAQTFSGFMENPTGGQDNPTASSGSSINFGAGTRGATFQINGVNNDDSSENQHRQGVALSTIQEFQVLTNNYSAEFGRGYGAVVLVQTKSGTNQLKGDVYGSFNDNQWNAKPFFFRNQPKADNQRTVLGLTGGFPILHDRLFGYANYEKNTLEGQLNRARDIIITSDLSLPRLTLGNDTPANRAFIENFLRRFPTTTPNRTDLSPRTLGYLATTDQPDEDYSARLDFDPIENHHLTGRYQNSHQVRDFTKEAIIGEDAKQDNEQSNFGLNWTYVFSSNIVGEFRYGLGVRSTNVDVKAGNDTPILRFTGTPVASSQVGSAGVFPIHRDQEDNQYVANVSALIFTNHSLKVGLDLRRMALDDLADDFSRGFWTFQSASCGQTFPSPYHAFFAGCVFRYEKAYGNFFLENRIDENNVYLEDNWQVFPNLTLNVGMRYEAVTEPEEIRGRLEYGFVDQEYFDPRVGFAWTIGGKNRWVNMVTGGSGRSVIRGGYGVYHGRVFQSIFSQGGVSMRLNPPNATRLIPMNQTNISDPTNGFQFVAGQPITTRIGSFTLVDPGLEMPMTTQWNLTFEREMPWNSSLRITYNSKQGEDLIRYLVDNQPLSPFYGPVVVPNHPFNAPAAGHPDLRGKTIDRFNPDPCAGTGLPGVPTNTACPNAVPLADNEISVRVPRTNERRPDPRFTGFFRITNLGESDYEAVELQWLKRFSNNLHFQAQYTYSTYNDNLSEATFVGAGDTNFTGSNAQYAWGRSRFDTPHRFTFYGSYRLPFFANRNDWLGLVLGGWQIAPVIRYASGNPFTVTAGALDLDFDGFSEGRPILLDPSVIGTVIDDPKTSRSRLPISAFRPLQRGDTFDNIVPRNAFRGDDFRQLDIGLYKNFTLPWDDTLVLRIEGFNLTDDVQYGFPASSIATPATFMNITSQRNSPRILQVGLRYLY